MVSIIDKIKSIISPKKNPAPTKSTITSQPPLTKSSGLGTSIVKNVISPTGYSDTKGQPVSVAPTAPQQKKGTDISAPTNEYGNTVLNKVLAPPKNALTSAINSRSYTPSETITKDKVPTTITSKISNLFGKGSVTPAGVNISQQKETQANSYYNSVVGSFQSNPESFVGKPGVYVTSSPIGNTYTLNEKYFEANPPTYNIVKPSRVSYIADIELGTTQFAISTGHWFAEQPLKMLGNAPGNTDKTWTLGKDYLTGDTQVIPYSKNANKILSTTTVSGKPIAIVGNVALLGTAGVGATKNIRALGLVKGSAETIKGFSPYQVKNTFYSDTNFVNKNAITNNLIGSKNINSFTSNKVGSKVYNLNGEMIGDFRSSYKSFQTSPLSANEKIPSISATELKYNVIKDFKTIPQKQITTAYSITPTSSFQTGVASFNGKTYPASYSESKVIIQTKTPKGITTTKENIYGIRTLGDNFAYAGGKVNTDVTKIKGLNANVFTKEYTPTIKGFGTTTYLKPTKDIFQISGGQKKSSIEFFDNLYKPKSVTKPIQQTKPIALTETKPIITENKIQPTIQGTKIEPIYKTSTRTWSRTYTPSSIFQIEKTLTATKPSPLVFTSPITKLSEGTKQNPLVIDIYKQPQATRTRQTQTNVFAPINFNINTPSPRAETFKAIPGFVIPFGGDFGSRMFRKNYKGKQPKKYTPSFGAIVFKQYGKAPKKITGLESRPITKGFTWSYNKIKLPKLKI
jgi:hypothetical protein